jgi:hypothetical protein
MSDELITSEAGGTDEFGQAQEDSAREVSAHENSARALHAGSGSFWLCGAGIHALDDPTPFGQENALQRLGKPPFEKSTRSRFRLLGYLATVYEHVSQDVGKQIGNHEAAKARSEDEAAEPAP